METTTFTINTQECEVEGATADIVARLSKLALALESRSITEDKLEARLWKECGQDGDNGAYIFPLIRHLAFGNTRAEAVELVASMAGVDSDEVKILGELHIESEEYDDACYLNGYALSAGDKYGIVVCNEFGDVLLSASVGSHMPDFNCDGIVSSFDPTAAPWYAIDDDSEVIREDGTRVYQSTGLADNRFRELMGELISTIH